MDFGEAIWVRTKKISPFEDFDIPEQLEISLDRLLEKILKSLEKKVLLL